MTVLRARRVVTPAGVLAPGEIVVEEETIAAVRPTTAEVPDVTLCPGFVDLQVNGLGEIDVATAAHGDWDQLDSVLVRCGTTTWLPTLVTAPADDYAASIRSVAAAMQRPASARPHLAGVHLEGPFLARTGAHDPQRVRAVDLAWVAALPSAVRLVTIAPELPGAVDAITTLTRRGVVVGIGHTDATAEQTEIAVAAGATFVTHCFNAMAPMTARAPGAAGVALTDDRLTIGLIADGIHVDARMLRLAFRAKGSDHIVLVTDAVAWQRGEFAGQPIALVDGAPRRPDGTLAGSALSMDRAVATCVAAGIPLADAVAAASRTPADLMGLRDRGGLIEGRRADIVALDERLAAIGTWVGGVRVR